MKKAFTLIELLVVISVIVILAAILFPVFVKARERARCTHCISNLRQIGVATGQYLSDWDETYPYAYTDIAVVRYHDYVVAFRDTMLPYTSGKAIWRCPSDTGEVYMVAVDTFHQKTPPFYSEDWDKTSYGYFGVGIMDSDGRIGGYPASRVKQPARAVLSMEIRPWHGGYDPMAHSMLRSPALLNVLYCDGHVARRTRAQWGEDAATGVLP